ncbi:hypothetical protein [Streptococcus loxodontisalivarius]|uniref:Uncharacterized protein n=1 Tax=Streptococcus loxodontisalivarius TaxID=1349415 RepID=A0ABS2PUA9_9STRE|nr:hypothetical protein [Streptococcus loxodontisalivarius]MBM7643125.1 hypothetical protein [Streptococcus loxodontisalivarius]
MFELKPEIKQALTDMDFVQQYKNLSDEFASDIIPYDERLDNIDISRVLQIIEDLGYKSSYDRREKFFKIECRTVHNPILRFNTHLVLREGSIELIWSVTHNHKVIMGPDIGYLPVLIDKKNPPIPDPVVISYKELKEVLKINFDMFKQFQDLLIAYYEKEDNS